MEKAALALNRSAPACAASKGAQKGQWKSAGDKHLYSHLLVDFIDLVTDTVETRPGIIYILSFGCSRFEQLEMVRVNSSFVAEDFDSRSGIFFLVLVA